VARAIVSEGSEIFGGKQPARRVLAAILRTDAGDEFPRRKILLRWQVRELHPAFAFAQRARTEMREHRE